jgi:hypothetical protein
MESDKAFRQFKQRRERIFKRLEEGRRQTDAFLEELEHRTPTAADAARFERLRGQPRELLQDYTDVAGAFLEYIAGIIESNRRSEMTEQSARTPRNQAQIQQLSEDLTTKMRLERVDEAIKELLAFLVDTDFFAVNATTGRRRRLRALQNTIENALDRK